MNPEKKTKSETAETKSETVISKETMHTVLGVGISLALIGVVVMVVKNMK